MSQSTRTATPPQKKSQSPSTATKRLLHELQDYSSAPNDCLLHLGPVRDDDLLFWEAVLKGVRGSTYEGPSDNTSHLLQRQPLHVRGA